MTPTHDVVHHETIELRVFVEALRWDFQASARARHVTVDALVFSDRLEGDPSLLRRMLIGLVGAAVGRAPAGTNVSLVVSPRERYTEFRVADESVGASPRGDASVVPFYRAAAEAQGGRLSVAETDSGTVVCLAFPTGIELGARGLATHFPLRSGTFARAVEFAPVAGTPTILVVDDEPMIRSFIRRALNDAGYGVLEAGSAEEAFEILKPRHATIALLLSDVGLPGASGAELVRRARLLAPGLPALLMSAGNPAVLAQRGVIPNETDLLQKPFDVSDLLAKIGQELSLKSARVLELKTGRA